MIESMGLRSALRLAAASTPVDGPNRSPTPAIASPWADRSHLETIVFADLFPEAELLPITRAEAMSVPAVARARTIIATTIARLPLVVYRDGDAVTDASPYAVIRQPELGRARYVTLLWTLDDLIFHGWAVWRIVDRYAAAGEDGRGWPRHVERITHDRLGLEADRVYIDGKPARLVDLIIFDGPHEGILNFAARPIRAAARLDRAAANRADNPIPAIDLHQTGGDPMSDEAIDALTGRWTGARRGRNGGVAYTNQVIEARALGGDTAAQLLIDGRTQAAVEMARVVGVPASSIDAGAEGQSMTYSNMEQKGQELIDYGLGGYMAAIESRLSLDDVLARGVTCGFRVDALTRGAFKDRMDGYKTAIQSEVYTVDELRALERGIPWEEPG